MRLGWAQIQTKSFLCFRHLQTFNNSNKNLDSYNEKNNHIISSIKKKHAATASKINLKEIRDVVRHFTGKYSSTDSDSTPAFCYNMVYK